MLVLAGLLVIVVFVILGIVGFLQKQKHPSSFQEGESEIMVKHFYYYLVLFATLMMSIGGSVGVFMSAADYVSPRSNYQSFQDYKTMVQEKQTPAGQTSVSDVELYKSYEELVATEKQRAKDNAINGIIKSLGWIIIPLPIFFYFQRQIRKKE